MDNKLLNKIPKKYHPIIKDIYRDDDGFWATLNCNGQYILKNYLSDYTIHEDNLKEFLSKFKLISIK